jgi:tetratricopeptide (TPR) repeat protein
MDSQPKGGIVNRFVSGIKDKTVKYAESKLQKTIQEVPEEAILGFVASAVRLGAQRLEVRIQANDLVLTHDAKKISESVASQLHRGIEGLPELSKAFRFHLGHDEGQIQLDFLTENGMFSANYKGFVAPQIDQADLNDMKLAKMTTRIILKGSGNYRRVNQAMGNELPEVALIRKRCFLTPVDIVVSGRAIERYTLLPESLVTGTSFEREHHQTLSTLVSTPSQGTVVNLSFLANQLRAISAGMCGIARSSADAGWFRLENGIARPLTDIPWPARTWGVIAVSDLSMMSLLESEIILLTNTLTAKLFEAIQEETTDRADEALTYLEQNRQLLTEAGHAPVVQDRIFLKLREILSPSSDPRVLNSRLELASSLEASGEIEESQKLYADVLPIWESEALNHFDKYRFEEGAALWQRALSLREKLGTDKNELADKYLRLAEIGRDQRLGFAEQAYRRALQLLRTCGQPNKEREYKVLLGLALILKKNRVLTESLTLAEEAQKLMVEIRDGKETRELVPVLKLQAEIYDLMNDYSRSTDFEQKALLLKFKR